MKRLFTLRYQSGKQFTEDGKPLYFDKKMLAKNERDHLNRNVPNEAALKISPGPDHWRTQK